MREAIVTGGSGFIGSWLIQELLANDYKVIAIVRDKNKLRPEFLKNANFRFIEKSIEDVGTDDFIEGHHDVFYHIAWSGVAPEEKNNVGLQLHNIVIALKALELANSLKTSRFISSGTVAEYALSTNIINLDARQTPNDMYGAAKVSAHFFLEIRARQLHQHFNWVMIPSTFGERRKDNNILTYTITTLLKGQKPRYGDLQQMWDFLYVGEVVRALRLIGEKGMDDKVYSIGSGEYHPLKYYIQTVRNLINPMLPLGIGEIPSMSSKSYSSCVNIYDLIKDTGFIPQVSFEEGTKKTIDYYKTILGESGGCANIE